MAVALVDSMTGAVRTREFVGLFTRHARWIYSYILAQVPQTADAEEVFQETSTVLWEKFEQFTPGTDFRAWAARVAHFQVLSFRNSRRRVPQVFSDAFCEAVDHEIVALGDALDGQYRALADCFARLTPRDREIVERRYQPGATTKQVAESLERSIHSVYRSLVRIHQSLLECMNLRRAEEGSW
jgi:RNA polymerase sigma-70 factor (ECF subfamily)